MKKDRRVTITKNIIIGIIAIVVIGIPFWLVLVNSFKPAREANLMQLGLPLEWNAIENYTTVMVDGNILRGLTNTIIVSVIGTISVILISSFAGWIFARVRSKITSALYFLCIGGILVPIGMITCIKVFKVFHIYGDMPGLIIFYLGAFLPFSIFFFTGFIKTIPLELEESARIDGCSHIGVFIKIIFPLLGPVISTLTIFLILFVWNDFYTPMYLLRSSRDYTMTLGLYNFIGKYYIQIRWELVFADLIIVSMPLLIVYFILQKRIVAGIMGGAIKQ